jgi:hypothetical protein
VSEEEAVSPVSDTALTRGTLGKVP